MESVRSGWRRGLGLSAVIFSFTGLLFECTGQGTLQITFDGPPVPPPRSSLSVLNYYELGMWFVPIAGQGTFSRVGPGSAGEAQNGTAYLGAAFTQSLMFDSADGSSFDLYSVDLAEYSTLFQTPLTVRFIGYRQDGSTITTNVVTDGIIDGTGSLADFETFQFGPEWSGLSRVEIPTALWSLDNLVVSIPEPGTWALLVLGGSLAGCRFWKRRPKH